MFPRHYYFRNCAFENYAALIIWNARDLFCYYTDKGVFFIDDNSEYLVSLCVFNLLDERCVTVAFEVHDGFAQAVLVLFNRGCFVEL